MPFQLFLFFSKHNQTSSLYLIQQVQLQLIIFISCAGKSTFEMGEIHCILIAERHGCVRRRPFKVCGPTRYFCAGRSPPRVGSTYIVPRFLGFVDRHFWWSVTGSYVTVWVCSCLSDVGPSYCYRLHGKGTHSTLWPRDDRDTTIDTLSNLGWSMRQRRFWQLFFASHCEWYLGLSKRYR